VVDNLLKIGIQPWFNLGYGNRLYTPGAAHESAVGWVPLNSDEARRARVRYAGKIAARFAGRVKHWEMWNEPNIKGFWQPEAPDPARYVAFVKMTAPVIRRRVPKAVLIGGAFSRFPVLDYAEGRARRHRRQDQLSSLSPAAGNRLRRGSPLLPRPDGAL
jgi:polysaccharide biosynthesis protein PslG